MTIAYARLAGVALAVAACSSSKPLAPPPTTPANIAGSWFDSTSAKGAVFLLYISQHGDGVFVTDSGRQYVRSQWNGAVWWTNIAGQTRDTALGTVVGDSVALCDLVTGPPCPNEVLFARGNTLADYLAPVVVPSDTVGAGAIFARGAWSTADTIAPPNAPLPINVAGVWLGDSIAWTPVECAGGVVLAVQSGLVVTSDRGNYLAREWARICSTGWQPVETYLGYASPYPCTTVDSCEVYLFYPAYQQFWTLTVESPDTLLASVVFDSLFASTYLVRDTGVSPLSRLVRPGRPGAVALPHMTPLEARHFTAHRAAWLAWFQRRYVRPSAPLLDDAASPSTR